jgi:hypothetical protein
MTTQITPTPTADGVCFKSTSGKLEPRTFIGRLDSQARLRCEGIAEQCISWREREGGSVVEVRLSEVVR